jgi:hypothetical protein
VFVAAVAAATATATATGAAIAVIRGVHASDEWGMGNEEGKVLFNDFPNAWLLFYFYYFYFFVLILIFIFLILNGRTWRPHGAHMAPDLWKQIRTFVRAFAK